MKLSRSLRILGLGFLVGIGSAITAPADPPPHYTEQQIYNNWADGGFVVSANATIPTFSGFLTSQQILNIWAAAGFPVNVTGGGGGGSATNVSLNNITVGTLPIDLTMGARNLTTTGNLTAGTEILTTLPTWPNQTQNKFWSSPNGSSGIPTFRALVAADIPSIPTTLLTGSVSLSQGGTAANLTGSGIAHGFLSLGSGGTAVGVSQPGFSDLSGSISAGQIANGTVAFANLTGTATSGQIPDLSATYSIKAGNSGIITVGTIGTGTWQGTKVGDAYGGTNWDSSAITGFAYVTAGTWGNLTNAQTLSQIGAAPAAGSSSIVTVGTISSGTWSGTAVAETKGGTNQSTYITGDILYASGSNTLSKLAIGSSTKVLTVSGGVPSWQTPSASGGFTANTINSASNVTMVAGNVYFINATSGTVTLTAPTAVGIGGQECAFCLINTGATVVLNTTSSQTVSGQASGAINSTVQYNFFKIMSDSTNWQQE